MVQAASARMALAAPVAVAGPAARGVKVGTGALGAPGVCLPATGVRAGLAVRVAAPGAQVVWVARAERMGLAARVVKVAMGGLPVCSATAAPEVQGGRVVLAAQRVAPAVRAVTAVRMLAMAGRVAKLAPVVTAAPEVCLVAAAAMGARAARAGA